MQEIIFSNLYFKETSSAIQGILLWMKITWGTASRRWTLTTFYPPESQKWISHVKGTPFALPSLPRMKRVEGTNIIRQGIHGQQGSVNKTCYFFTNWTQTSLFCKFFSSLLLFCLKDIKSAWFGLFFLSHISMSMYES